MIDISIDCIRCPVYFVKLPFFVSCDVAMLGSISTSSNKTIVFLVLLSTKPKLLKVCYSLTYWRREINLGNLFSPQETFLIYNIYITRSG